MMDTFWHVLGIIVMIGVAIGGLVLVGYLMLWIFGFLDWMNRGSH